MKTRILVFPCGSEIGLEINRALANSIHVYLIGASSTSSNHGKYVYKNYIDGLPFIDDKNFINEINLIIDKYNIDYVYPAHDSVLLKLANFKESLHCDVISSDLETCAVCRSKKKTYELFKGKIETPDIYSRLDNNIHFPAFLKPDIGQGAKGTATVYSKEEIQFYLDKDKSLILMEYLPGKEYTIDCFTDRHGQLLFCGARERERINNGISVATFPVYNKNLMEMAQTINNVLKLRGAWFFQVKQRTNGKFVLMEIEPRIAGSMGLYRNMGVNLPLLSVMDRLNIDVKVICNKFYIKMDRALISRFVSNISYDNVYIDLDDTIIINNCVNTIIIAFIYQCLNKNVKVHLLSRHSGNIFKVLEKYRIDHIFDTIINIRNDDDKSNYIKEISSIFIDDSFSERMSVYNKLGIPTFEVSAVESLLDWRT